MQFNEFKALVTKKERPSMWRWEYNGYYTPDYTYTADEDYYLRWFYNELVKVNAFEEKEDDTDVSTTGEPEPTEVQDEPSTDETGATEVPEEVDTDAEDN